MPRMRWRRARKKVKTAARARETGEPGARREEDVGGVHRLQGDHEHAPRTPAAGWSAPARRRIWGRGFGRKKWDLGEGLGRPAVASAGSKTEMGARVRMDALYRYQRDR